MVLLIVRVLLMGLNHMLTLLWVATLVVWSVNVYVVSIHRLLTILRHLIMLAVVHGTFFFSLLLLFIKQSHFVLYISLQLSSDSYWQGINIEFQFFSILGIRWHAFAYNIPYTSQILWRQRSNILSQHLLLRSAHSLIKDRRGWLLLQFNSWRRGSASSASTSFIVLKLPGKLLYLLLETVNGIVKWHILNILK